MRLIIFALLASLAVCMEISGTPIQDNGLAAHSDKEQLRDMLCYVKGHRTPADCIQDASIDRIIERIMKDEDRDIVSPLLARFRAQASAGRLPLPPGAKRDAFYSDWKRK